MITQRKGFHSLPGPSRESEVASCAVSMAAPARTPHHRSLGGVYLCTATRLDNLTTRHGGGLGGWVVPGSVSGVGYWLTLGHISPTACRVLSEGSSTPFQPWPAALAHGQDSHPRGCHPEKRQAPSAPWTVACPADIPSGRWTSD